MAEQSLEIFVGVILEQDSLEQLLKEDQIALGRPLRQTERRGVDSQLPTSSQDSQFIDGD